MGLFYVPIGLWIALLSLRFRGLTFLSVNPAMEMSGLYGEHKANSLLPLSGLEELAAFEVIEPAPLQDRVSAAAAIMQSLKLTFPVVLKPDQGQRGSDVAVIRSEMALQNYLSEQTGRVLLQQHISGEEFGVFYLRYPKESQGRIYSITHKTFPVVVGDGISSLETLLAQHPRTHYLFDYLLALHAHQLDRVLAAGESFKVVEIGSHCRGSVFLNADHLITAALVTTMDRVSQTKAGFYFGRYDVRVPSASDLQKGQNIKVLEVNGVTSESTNIYDPSHSVLTAYRILFKQWYHAFAIGQANVEQGAARVSFWAFLRYVYQKLSGSETGVTSKRFADPY